VTVKVRLDSVFLETIRGRVEYRFTRLTGMFKNLNYAAEGSQERGDLRTQLLAAIDAAPQQYQAAAE